MAESLAVASGIAGLLSLGIQVTHSLISFYTTYKDQDTNLAKIMQNLNNLQSVFRALKVAVDERRSQADTLDLLREAEKFVRKCEEIIAELKIECEKFHKVSATGLKDRVKVAGRRAAYPFRKSTLQKLEEDVSDICENISFALDVLQLKSQSQIKDDMSEVKSLVERTNASQVSFTIRCWLMAPDASLNHNEMCAKCHPSTGLWFVNGHQFRTWLEERNSFLWLNGFAGCGKSVLCSTAIQHTFREMRHKKEVGIAFFYFSFNDEAKQDDNGMLRTLLLQLSLQLQDGERDLEQLHALYKSGSPPVHALLDSLRRFLERFRDCYILLDALDESPRDRKREGVFRAIQVIRSWSMSGVHLLVTSRNELDIRESLGLSRGQDLSLRNPGIDRDIANFVFYQLKHDAKLQKWKARHDEIQKKLTRSAQGVFRYVECQFNALRRARNRNQLDECLRTLPRDLDETYERILCSIADEYVEDVRRVLTLLCFSTRPLTVNELIDAHAVDLSEPPHLDLDGRSYEQDDLVDICLGLIEIAASNDDNRQTTLSVRIAHFSVQEYLQSDRISQQNSRIFAMRSAPANTEIAQICLVYLLEPILSREILDEAKVTEFPFAHFAAMYWFHHHANSGEGKAANEKLVLNLFRDETKAFVTWIRLHDMDRPWNMQVDYNRPLTDMVLPIYYAGLLGLEPVLNSILPIGTVTAESSDTVNAQGGRFGNALQAASYEGHERVVQMLLDRGAHINAHGGFYGNVLQAASRKGRENLVEMLLDRGADVNAQGGEYGNALQAASVGGHEKVVQMLLDRGTDVNAQGGYYDNALHAASRKGHEKVVQMLLDRGAHINSHGGYYGNALPTKLISNIAVRAQELPHETNEHISSMIPQPRQTDIEVPAQPATPLFKCKICGDKAPLVTASPMKRHVMGVHYPEFTRHCAKCDLVTPRRHRLKEHIKLAHDRSPTDEEVGQQKREHDDPPICPLCCYQGIEWKDFRRCFISHCAIEKHPSNACSSRRPSLQSIEETGGAHDDQIPQTPATEDPCPNQRHNDILDPIQQAWLDSHTDFTQVLDDPTAVSNHLS